MPELSADKVRLMIVDDIAETRENLRKLLQFEADFEVVATARTGQEALKFAREQQPHVVLMDINMPDMDGISATEAIVRDVPFTQIVILSVQSDTDYMRRAMLAGARDFLSKPPAADDLVNTIRKLGKRSWEEQEKLARTSQARVVRPGESAARPVLNGKIISVYSPKGGVGCTTVATNMALALHSDETRAALVDGNIHFGDIAVFLNLRSKNGLADLADRADDLDSVMVDSVMATHPSRLKILLAPNRPELADEIGEGVTGANRVKKILAFLKQEYAYVVVDTASALTEFTLAILDMSDAILLLATPDIPALKDARLFFDLMEALDYPSKQIVFVLNRMDKRLGINAEAIADNIKHAVAAQIINDERAVISSINRGVPFILGDKNRPLVQGLLDTVRAVKGALKDPEPARPAPVKKGFFERLRLFGA